MNGPFGVDGCSHVQTLSPLPQPVSHERKLRDRASAAVTRERPSDRQVDEADVNGSHERQVGKVSDVNDDVASRDKVVRRGDGDVACDEHRLVREGRAARDGVREWWVCKPKINIPPQSKKERQDALLPQLTCTALTLRISRRSRLIVALAFVSGCQVVALDPSTAASAYCPGTIAGSSTANELSLPSAVAHCATLPSTKVPVVRLVGTTRVAPSASVLEKRFSQI